MKGRPIFLRKDLDPDKLLPVHDLLRREDPTDAAGAAECAKTKRPSLILCCAAEVKGMKKLAASVDADFVKLAMRDDQTKPLPGAEFQRAWDAVKANIADCGARGRFWRFEFVCRSGRYRSVYALCVVTCLLAGDGYDVERMFQWIQGGYSKAERVDAYARSAQMALDAIRAQGADAYKLGTTSTTTGDPWGK